MKSQIARLKSFYEKYERLFVPGFLLLGFLFDVLTFKSLQIEQTFLLLGAYAIAAAFSVFYIIIYDGRNVPPHRKILKWIRLAMPVVSSITFGSLLSSSLLFYWYSGSFVVSWPLIAVLVILMTTNEVFRNFYLRPTVQIGVFAFTFFSYFSILFPFIFNSLSEWIFLLGGTTSLIIMIIAVTLLRKFSPTAEEKKHHFFAVVILVFASMNALYFLNIIPPIPLSVREAGVYYDVTRVNDDYTLLGQDENFIDRFIPGVNLKRSAGESVYAYTEIFAPGELTTTIYHRWEYFNPTNKSWETRDRLSFTIKGGREDGFRGYTRKTSLQPGRWRVTVETARGQGLGRIPFTVVLE
jgi:hypothetical protein